MRKLVAALIAVVLMMPALASPAMAGTFTYTGTCTSGAGRTPYSKIATVRYKPGARWYGSAYGEAWIRAQDPCTGGTDDGWMAVLPANLQGAGSDQIVQLGYQQFKNGDRYFVKTKADNLSGYSYPVNSIGPQWAYWNGSTWIWSQYVEAPQLGHKYYFWVRSNENHPLYGWAWRYEIMDETDGQKWYFDEPASWTQGVTIWWGFEWYNQQDRIIGSDYIDDLRYKLDYTNTWIYRQGTASDIKVQCNSNGYVCSFDANWQSNEYNHWHAWHSTGDNGISGNRFNATYDTTP